MLRLLADQNFNGRILRGLRRRVVGLDVVRAFDEGLASLEDPAVLDWAANDLSHRSTASFVLARR